MNYQLIALTVSLTAFLLLTVGGAIKYGIRPSVSNLFYKMRNRNLFTVYLFIFSIGAIIAGVSPDLSDKNELARSIMIFLSGSCISFVGSAANYKEKTEGNFHYANAFLGILFGAVFMILSGFVWLTVLMAILIVLARALPRNWTWWQEHVAFFFILYVIYMKI